MTDQNRKQSHNPSRRDSAVPYASHHAAYRTQKSTPYSAGRTQGHEAKAQARTHQARMNSVRTNSARMNPQDEYWARRSSAQRSAAYSTAHPSARSVQADSRRFSGGSLAEPSRTVRQHDKQAATNKRSLAARFKSKSTLAKVLLIVFSVLFVALLIATGILCWNQWLRFDDRADFQGTWQMEGTTTSFVITNSEIQLTSEVAYSYELDTFNKTIAFSFGNLEGGGAYAFSPDRTELIITEADSEHEGATIPSKLIKLTNADGSKVVRELEGSQ